MSEKLKIEKGKAYTAIHKETKQTVDILGINTASDLVLVGSIPQTVDALSNYKTLKPAEKLSEEQLAAREASFGSNWEN